MKHSPISLLIATTVASVGFVVKSSPVSAQSFAQSSYYVRHDFQVNFGGLSQPNILGAVAGGDDFCVSPFDFDNYSNSQFGFPSVGAVGSASVSCSGASAQSSSSAIGTIAGNTLTGTTQANGFAEAFAPPGGFARARSAAALVAGQLAINPFGRIIWRPLFGSYVGGSASAFARSRPRDPIAYNITDPNTGDILLEGNLLDISVEYSDSGDKFGSRFEWGTEGDFDSTINLGNEEQQITTDNLLEFSFLNNGSFTIDLTDPAVTNPGFLNVACQNGQVSDLETSGRFVGVALPSVGNPCSSSIDLSTLDLNIDYDFTGLIPASEVNLEFELGGDGEAVAGTPEPSSMIGILALGIIGGGATLKRKLKFANSTEK